MNKKQSNSVCASALQITFISISAMLLTLGAVPARAATFCVATAGYWASHPDAWCVPTLQLGCLVYTEDQAIAFIQNPTSGDKTYSLAAQLIAAKLNLTCAGANSNCVALAISSADAWLCLHPVGSGVTSNSPAWKQISPTNDTLTLYNEGRLCAPKCRS
jgi:hypothetical protein